MSRRTQYPSSVIIKAKLLKKNKNLYEGNQPQLTDTICSHSAQPMDHDDRTKMLNFYLDKYLPEQTQTKLQQLANEINGDKQIKYDKKIVIYHDGVINDKITLQIHKGEKETVDWLYDDFSIKLPDDPNKIWDTEPASQDKGLYIGLDRHFTNIARLYKIKYDVAYFYKFQKNHYLRTATGNGDALINGYFKIHEQISNNTKVTTMVENTSNMCKPRIDIKAGGIVDPIRTPCLPFVWWPSNKSDTLPNNSATVDSYKVHTECFCFACGKKLDPNNNTPYDFFNGKMDKSSLQCDHIMDIITLNVGVDPDVERNKISKFFCSIHKECNSFYSNSNLYKRLYYAGTYEGPTHRSYNLFKNNNVREKVCKTFLWNLMKRHMEPLIFEAPAKIIFRTTLLEKMHQFYQKYTDVLNEFINLTQGDTVKFPVILTEEIIKDMRDEKDKFEARSNSLGELYLLQRNKYDKFGKEKAREVKELEKQLTLCEEEKYKLEEEKTLMAAAQNIISLGFDASLKTSFETLNQIKKREINPPSDDYEIMDAASTLAAMRGRDREHYFFSDEREPVEESKDSVDEDIKGKANKRKKPKKENLKTTKKKRKQKENKKKITKKSK